MSNTSPQAIYETYVAALQRVSEGVGTPTDNAIVALWDATGKALVQVRELKKELAETLKSTTQELDEYRKSVAHLSHENDIMASRLAKGRADQPTSAH